MPGLFPLKKTRAPDRQAAAWLPPPCTIPWHVITRRYSPTSRRTFRRILLAAQARGIRVSVQHDGGHLFRLHLLTLTGTPAALVDFRRLMDRMRPRLGPWWKR
ncbi:hypothetical protein ABZ897_15920 [Nonomuraea sp. NPDC046802]|uniref:hypothetical protein n=1 Tax=Nonomuraea sp. NPDC046802 TaxID=3154919 RepID=UPI0033EBA017